MSAAPLVQPSAAREHTRAVVEHACAHLGTNERAAAEAALLQFAASDTLLDDAAYVLAHATDASVHFHVLGALLSQLARLTRDDPAREVPSLVRMRDWLLELATVRDAPHYVVTRQLHAVVLLTKRASALLDVEPILALGQHATTLIQAPAYTSLGLQLAQALAEDMDTETQRSDDVHLGLRVEEHAWCHALVQIHVLPSLLPAVLTALHAAQRDTATLVSAADATHALLAWKWNTALPANGAHLKPEQLAEALRAPGRETGSVPAALAELLFSPELPVLLSTAARTASRAAEARPYEAWAMRRAAHDLRATLQTVAALSPGEHEALWAQQRTALAGALGSYVEETHSRIAPTSELVEEADVLRTLAQIYQGLVSGKSGCVLLGRASHEVESLLQVLALLTTSSFRAALHILPATGDEEALAEADATVTEVLALWRAILHALPASGASPVLDAVHAHVREHVVLSYQLGRLHAAELAAVHDTERGEEQASDVEAYDDQLVLYAALARTCVGAAVQQLADTLQALQATLAHAPSDAAWEQLHWIVLLGAHIAADPADAEVPSIPPEVARTETEAQDALLAFLHGVSLVLLPALVPHGPNDAQAASPQVVASLFWASARWVPTYLLRDDTQRVVAPLQGAAGEQVLEVLLAQVRTALDVWRGDADVLIAATGLLEAFAHTPGAMRVLLAHDTMQALVREALGALEALPDAAHPPLLRAIVRCLDTAQDGAVPAHEARAAYYPLVLDAVQARIAAAVRASAAPHLAPSVHAALRLVQVLAACADPCTSRNVHEQLLAQLPRIVDMAQAQVAHPDVLSAALEATSSVLHALEELDAPHPDAIAAAHALLGLVRPILGDAETESLLVLYLRTTMALAQLSTADTLEPWTVAQPTNPAQVAAEAFAAVAPTLTTGVLSVVPVRETVAECTTTLLLKCGTALLGAAQGTPHAAPSPLDLLDGLGAPLAVGTPFEVAMRAVAYCMGTADTTTDTQVAALAPALGLLVAKVPDFPPHWAHAPLVQAVLDALAWDLVRALLLRPLHSTVFSPLVLALRALTLARIRAEWLGAQGSYFAALEHACATEGSARPAVLAEAVQSLLQRIVASSPAPPGPNVAPALAARLLAKEEQGACVALCRALRPQLMQTRGVLCVVP